MTRRRSKNFIKRRLSVPLFPPSRESFPHIQINPPPHHHADEHAPHHCAHALIAFGQLLRSVKLGELVDAFVAETRKDNGDCPAEDRVQKVGENDGEFHTLFLQKEFQNGGVLVLLQRISSSAREEHEQSYSCSSRHSWARI